MSCDDQVDADGKADAIARRLAAGAGPARYGTASKSLAEATAHMGAVAAHLEQMGNALAAEARSFEEVGRQLDAVEARLDSLADLAKRWADSARALRRHPPAGATTGEAAAAAHVYDECDRQLRRAVGG